ncbi:Zinc-binding alcohol dehydrogenase domain-containing protein 2 [Phytophthora nicotianae]|nr:Zinc-binding alcohol dehydrogenase domain-containing protein 2 [Phytophthora nicotianae]
MRNALAELAMRLVDADDREEFRKADGVTALAEVLTNVTAVDSSRVSAIPERLSAALSLFLRAATDPDTINFGIALSDLLCNLCCDQAYCLLLICELDTRRPPGHFRHSGVVYLAELTEKTRDDALKQSMEALVHNLSWSDPAGKRSIQKLALSSFMNTFALEPGVSS